MYSRTTAIQFVVFALCTIGIMSLTSVLHAQSYSPMYPPQGQWQESIVCRDQFGDPIPYAGIQIYPGAYLYTNAHFHTDSSHPYSSVSPTYGYADGDGVFSYTFSTTLVGQAELLDVWCSAPGGDLWTRFEHAVGYNDVYYNNHPEIWVRIGGTDTGVDTGHGSTHYNRYMRTSAAYGLYYATLEYIATHAGHEKVCTNDMALPFGGKFDICAINGTGKSVCGYQNKPWQSPHSTHDRGTAADVAGPNSSQCDNDYEVDLADFEQACESEGALPAYTVVEGNHVHCNWANPATYPH